VSEAFYPFAATCAVAAFSAGSDISVLGANTTISFCTFVRNAGMQLPLVSLRLIMLCSYRRLFLPASTHYRVRDFR
jgi:hypothetical protein